LRIAGFRVAQQPHVIYHFEAGSKHVDGQFHRNIRTVRLLDNQEE
jgi:hypothetical protein